MKEKFKEFLRAIASMTLIELMIVIASIGILLAIALPMCYTSCDFYEVNKCYYKTNGNPFNENADYICIIEKKNGYMKFKHVVEGKSTIESGQCVTYRRQNYVKK